MAKNLTFAFVCLLSLSACVHQPPLKTVSDWDGYQKKLAAIHHWQLQGSLNVKVPDDSVSRNIDWRQQQNDYSIYFSGTFGSPFSIYGDKRGVRLEQAGEKTLYAATAEQLLVDTIGYEIPVADLHYWVRGIWSPYKPLQSKSISSEGTLESLQQSGWTLTYDRYRREGEWNLPGRVIAVRDDIKLTLRVSDWQLF